MANEPQVEQSHVVRYRPDIDGLRAIAVLSVVLYHLHAGLLPGGFLGVDVFFVISGYLITLILWREITAGQFKITKFYERRIRRIMPALLLVLGVSTAAAAFILLPVDLVGFARSVFATLSFVANIYFWRDSDYFSRIAAEKPLLHMWSLGVEEQFYIFFPLVLIACFRLARRSALPIVLALIAVSFLLDIAMVRVGGATPAFYLLPSRAWELGGGAALALGLGPPQRQITATLGSVLGVLLLAIGLAFGPKLPLQGLPVATPAVLGAMLLIWGGSMRGGPAYAVFASKPLVGVGLISYSLYLWHWPILALTRYWLVGELNLAASLVALVAMFVLAVFSWRFVERPFRLRTMSSRQVVGWASLGTALVCVVAGGLMLGQGLPGRLSPRAAMLNASVGSLYRCPVKDYVSVGLSRGCVMNLPSHRPDDAQIVLIGNSHALMYTPVLADLLAARGLHGVLLNANSCIPSLIVNASKACLHQAGDYISAAIHLKARVVFIGLEWTPGFGQLVDRNGRIVGGSVTDGVVTGVSDTIARLQVAGKTVVLIGPIDQPGWDVASITSRSLAFGRPIPHPLADSRAAFDQAMGPVFRAFGNRQDIVFVRPDLIQCPQTSCDFIRNGQSLFSDDNHLARQALSLFRPSLGDGLASALQKSGEVSTAASADNSPVLADHSR